MEDQTPTEWNADQDPATVNLGKKKDGAFSKLGAAVKKASTDRQSAREELGRKFLADAEAAGPLVTSGVFGTSAVEIYQGGYVRVATAPEKAQQPAKISKKTPYEQLRSIKFTQPGQEQSSGFENSLGPAVSGLMKGGRAFMKSSAPGLAAAGIAHLAKNEARKAFLTVVTDKEIYTLINQIHNGYMNKVAKGHNEVGLVLETAGNSVLDIVEVAAPEARPEPHQVETHPAAAATSPTLSERLRELADLHRDGILSDDEFAAAKTKLLAEL
ncbi:SHOCT domain-containing protein [Nesterenkonia sp. DZ6]|uniref:SHOCT domain-containing protein n=1 Tax=Nesterenkonia sp. DZ6 TaxID=2901229 RepID=UPI001F4C83F4|nr:SHOCT domain-containing protein [Nesterenkonia sp. DZ6]MCH8560293.1 SHOCT domain-containing protein [Nesterenkonia sp. DZ6]